MNTKFIEFRNMYKEIIYRSYLIDEVDNNLVITYTFEIPGLTVFNPTISFSKDLIKNSFYKYFTFIKKLLKNICKTKNL